MRGSRTRKRVTRAFTLVELLTVLGIMAILLAITIGSMNGGRPIQCRAAGLSTAALFEEARQLARARGAWVYVLFHDDTSDLERYRRKIALVYSQPVSPPEGEAETSPGGEEPEIRWFPANSITLNEGVVFSLEDAGLINPPAAVQLNLEINGAVEGSGTAWQAYRFSPRGVCENEGARVILRAGFPDGEGNLRFTTGEFAGFLLQRLSSPIRLDPGLPLPGSP